MDLLNRYMEDIESRIQPEEQSIWAAWMEFAQGACKSSPFVPPARTPRPSAIEWMPIAINDAIENEESMLLSQLSFLNEQLRTANGLPLHIRANYGVGNLPSMFGAERFLMPPETNTLPNVRPLPGGLAAIEKLVEAPLPAPTAGNGRAIAAIGQKFMALRAQYPKFARYVIIDHPDLQGPMDVCELLVGSGLFYALYDEPALIHALLAKITAQYQRAMEFWLSIVPNAPEDMPAILVNYRWAKSSCATTAHEPFSGDVRRIHPSLRCATAAALWRRNGAFLRARRAFYRCHEPHSRSARHQHVPAPPERHGQNPFLHRGPRDSVALRKGRL